jgi:hypothetical protein
VLFGARPRLFVLEIILFAKHKHDDVGVLFNRARLSKIRKLRPLFVAAFDHA